MDTTSLHFTETIRHWDEALPLGNGDLGCLIWNRADQLRFSLDKGGIWDCSNPPEEQDRFNYADLQNLVARGKQKKIQKKYDDCYNRPTPTKLPAGKLILDLGVDASVHSHLSFFTGEAVLTAGQVTLHTFIHATENVGLIEINKTNIAITLENPSYGKEKKPVFSLPATGITQSLKNLHYPACSFFAEQNGDIDLQYFVQPVNDLSYGIMTAKKETDSKTLIAYTVDFGKDRTFITKARERVLRAVQSGYRACFETQVSWWRDYWSKSRITLEDQELEKQWYLNNYLLGSCSRKGHFPMPLQGVWTADNGSLPPWKGDYHHDLNTQMSYSSYLKANRLEQGECFIDYLLSMADAGRSFAKSFYGVEGLCLPSVMDIEGHALGGWCQYALSPTNQLWLCQIMARYYFFTKDQTYLPKIYAYLSEVGVFLLQLLKEKDGWYYLPLSSSPEIHDNSLRAWLTPNSNYDLALMRCFAENMIQLSREIGEKETEREWQGHLAKMKPLAVNNEQVLMLSPDESLRKSHRHHSHCMAIYPLRTLSYTTEQGKRMIDATIQNLETLGRKEWVGYSVAWMAQLYIVQGNGDKAAELLHDFFSYCCTSNGFHVNGDFQKKTDFHMKYRLFTLEGNFIATDAIQEMLLYSEKGRLNLFPAIPSNWKTAEFEHFRAFGGLLVSATLTDGRISYIKIEATADCDCSLENDIRHLTCTKGDVDPKHLHLKKGETLRFGCC